MAEESLSIVLVTSDQICRHNTVTVGSRTEMS